MECLLQALDEIEDLVFGVPLLWGSLRSPLLAGLTATLAYLLL